MEKIHKCDVASFTKRTTRGEVVFSLSMQSRIVTFYGV